MLVLGAGLSRTGTVSLKAALEELGLRPMSPWLRLPRQSCSDSRLDSGVPTARRGRLGDVATRLQLGARPSGRRVLKEISEYYPDVRVVLSIRDEDAWYASVRQTFFRWALPSHPRIRRVITRFLKATSGWLPPFPALGAEVVHQGLFHNRLDKEGAIAAYRRHNEAVLSTIPPERLLVWQASDGWQPLCAFLEVPVPDHPFPRLNDRTTMGGLLRQFPKEAARQVVVQGRQSLARLLPGRGPAPLGGAAAQDRRDDRPPAVGNLAANQTCRRRALAERAA